MNATMSEAPEKVLKAAEVARHLSCTPETVYRLVNAGQLRAIRVGRLLRIPESSLTAFIAGQESA
ncbi:MAG: helix-turn-helix domain-containing protein [Gulosibacter sp.]|uniref:helix-turn-helix domain-containing protein n=1 Tax=Gulosibacter sp. TaxID=2817531 RepID=UPI003F8F56FB